MSRYKAAVLPVYTMLGISSQFTWVSDSPQIEMPQLRQLEQLARI